MLPSWLASPSRRRISSLPLRAWARRSQASRHAARDTASGLQGNSRVGCRKPSKTRAMATLRRGADLCCLLFLLGFFFRFSSGPVKCRISQHVLAKLTHFTLARQHPQHRFQHPPHVNKIQKVAGGLTGSNNNVSNRRAFQSL